MDKKLVIKEVRKIVQEACRQSKSGERTWTTHILPVVNYSLILAKKLKADLLVLELSALLHDYASLLDYDKYKDEHHVYGAEFAKEILSKYNLPKDRINHIADCILSHRGSVKLKRKTLEARILSSADAMSHITELGDMFYLAYGVHKMDKIEGVEWLKAKIQRSWAKTMPEGKKMIKNEYKIAMNIINKVIKNQNL